MRSERILVVDDDPIQLKLTRILLSAKGYSVETVETADAALLFVKTAPPNLIIVDYHLPDFDGLELTRRFKADESTRDIPILMMSGSSGIVPEAAMRAGCVGFMLKPVRAQTFGHDVGQFFGGAPTRSGEAPVGSGRVLVVNDDALERRALEQALGSWGFRLEFAFDGAEALEAVKRSKPHVVVSDVLMPRMDGFKLCQAIRSDPNLKDLPIVLTTAGSIQKNDELLAKNVGANAFVLRNHDMKAVVEAVQAGIASGAPSVAPDPVVFSALRLYFLEEGERQTLRLLDELDRGLNRNAVRRTAHRWAGVAATFGYPEISDVAAQLEGLSVRGLLDGEQSKDLLVRLSSLFMEAVGRR